MKTSARFLAVILAVLMIAGTALTVSAFSDVEEGYAHASAIATLNQLGVIGGYEDGTFKPENNVERDEMAKLIFVLYTTLDNAGNGSVKFNDVAGDNWAAGYVSWCAAKSIVGGYGDGSFKPDNNVTYDEALKMTCAALGYTDFDSNLWPTDVRQKGLKELKLGEGIEAKGSDKLTRGEVAQLLYNALFVDMNETKVTYVYDVSYKNEDGTDAKVKVPVEVAKTLAADVWAFDEVIYRVVGTKNFALNGATKSSSDKIVKAVTVAEDGTLGTTPVELKLEEYGLEAYEKKTDDLIALDIMTVEKEGDIIPNATVLGSVKVAEVVISGRDETDAVITDEVKIDGVLYDDAAKSETLFAKLKKLEYATGTVTTTNAFTVDVTGDKADLEYPHMALVLDSEGDGVVDAICVDYYKLAKVVKVENVKATSTKEAYTKYSYNSDITLDTIEANFTSDKVADDKTLAKGDVFVYAQINGVTYINEVIAPVNAKVSKVIAGENAALTFADGATAKYVDGAKYRKNSGQTVGYNATQIATLLDKDTKAADYYIYNGYVVAATNVATVADSYDLALLLYVKDATDPEYNKETNKVEINYPAVLLINGEEVTVNLNATKAIDDKAATDASVTAHKIGTDANGFAVYSYTLVNYVVDDEDGTYSLYTTAGDLGDTDVVTTGNITLNANTGLYEIAGKSFELDDNSVIYYTYDNTATDPDDTYVFLGTYTKANILKKFQAKAIAQEAYLLENEDGTFTLLATVVTGKLEAPASSAAKTYINDARLIKYCAETSAAESVDGVAYYSYCFLDMETMKNGGQVVDTTLPVKTSGGATQAIAGYFYGWDESSKKYVKVTENETSAVKVATLTAVDTARNIVKLSGAAFNIDGVSNDFTNGVIINDNVKIFGTAGTSVYTYETFTVETLAELLEEATAETKTLDVAVGAYVDENDDIQIAWLIVDNYNYATVGENEVYTQTNDIVSRIEAGI